MGKYWVSEHGGEAPREKCRNKILQCRKKVKKSGRRLLSPDLDRGGEFVSKKRKKREGKKEPLARRGKFLGEQERKKKSGKDKKNENLMGKDAPSAIFAAHEPWDAGNTEELTRSRRANKSENSRRGDGSGEGGLR